MFFSRLTLSPELVSTSLANIITGQVYSKHRLLWDLFPEQEKRNFLFREEFEDEQLRNRAKIRGTPVYYLVSSKVPVSNSLFHVEPKEYNPNIKEGESLSFRLRVNATIMRNCKRHDVMMDAQNHFLTSLCEKHDIAIEPRSRGFIRKRDYKKAILATGTTSLDAQLQQFIEESERYQECLTFSQNRHQLLEWALKASADHAIQEWLARQGEKKGFVLTSLGKDFGINRYERHILPEKGKYAEFHSVDLSGRLEVKDESLFVNEVLFKGIGRARAFGCGLMLVRRA